MSIHNADELDHLLNAIKIAGRVLHRCDHLQGDGTRDRIGILLGNFIWYFATRAKTGFLKKCSAMPGEIQE